MAKAVEIEIRAKVAEAVKKFKEVSEALEKVKDEAKGTAGGMKEALDASDKATSSLGGLKTAAIAVAAAYAGLRLAKEVTTYLSDAGKAAADEEWAIQSLHTALVALGRYSPQLEERLWAQVEALKQLSGYDHTAIIEAAKFLAIHETIGNETLPRVLAVTVNLARFLGGGPGSLQHAAELVGRASEGMITSLKRAGIGIDEEIYKTRGFAGVLEELERKLAGQAEMYGKTSKGITELLKTSREDAKKEVGYITNDVLNPIKKAFIDYFTDSAKRLEEWRKSADFKQWVLDAKVWLFNALADVIEYIGKLPAAIVEVATVATPALKGLALAFAALAEGARGWAEIYYTLRSLDLSKQVTEMRNLAEAIPEQSAEFLKKADDLLKQKEEVDARLSQLAAAPSLMQTVAAWDGIERGIAGAKTALDKANLEGRFKGIADSLRGSAQQQTLISGLEKLGSEIGDNYDWIRGLDKVTDTVKKVDQNLKYVIDGQEKTVDLSNDLNATFTQVKDTAAATNLKTLKADVQEVNDKLAKTKAFLDGISRQQTVVIPDEGSTEEAGFQTGGLIPGGFGGGDRAFIRAEPGEFMMRKEAVRNLGVDFLDVLNRGERKGYVVHDLRLAGKSFPISIKQNDGDLLDLFLKELARADLIGK